ncbi:MAG: HNH endonuclease [Bacteroidetes bacterium]|nr:HNH endonuclease [Bacteroidota bacterium]
MINVKRIDCPDILQTGLTPPSKGQEETEQVILLLGKISGKPKRKSVYSDRAVRETLKKMFYGKCAYCESRITTIYSGDIEHFRPKSEYPWLIVDWDNLLFACPFCNQTHTHEIVGDEIREITQGKLEQFPLRTEAYKLTLDEGALFFQDSIAYKTALSREEDQRLLIQPCTDLDIEHFFQYHEDGRILAREGLNGIDKVKAETSINTYALQRLGLVQARAAKVVQIKAQLRRVEQAIINLNAHFEDPAESIWFEGILKKEMEILRHYQDPDQEYAGLARYLIQGYFKTFCI